MDAFQKFDTEDKAEAWFISQRWPDGITCPHSNGDDIAELRLPQSPAAPVPDLPTGTGASPEEIAQVLLRGGGPMRRVKAQTYRYGYGVCRNEVRFKDTLHVNGCCTECR